MRRCTARVARASPLRAAQYAEFLDTAKLQLRVCLLGHFTAAWSCNVEENNMLEGGAPDEDLDEGPLYRDGADYDEQEASDD